MVVIIIDMKGLWYIKEIEISFHCYEKLSFFSPLLQLLF